MSRSVEYIKPKIESMLSVLKAVCKSNNTHRQGDTGTNALIQTCHKRMRQLFITPDTMLMSE
jgi:hypothetical protein